MSDVVLIEDVAPHVRLIKLNRPEQLNALNAELCGSLHVEFERAAADRSCRVIVVTGEGRGFCAGLDLHGYGQAPGNDDTDPARDHFSNQQHMSRLLLKVRATPQPVIAAVNGPAAGFGWRSPATFATRLAAPSSGRRSSTSDCRTAT
jgi:enoyl-CoA hydratase/carnithine racemase